ncbi:MAG TPA: TraR/DksA family transcriptional regulator [Rhodanobacteraceae bacterium]|nr:TraR/DksA family transcriptional regulator [Rhodanobacteraceae bacterium]
MSELGTARILELAALMDRRFARAVAEIRRGIELVQRVPVDGPAAPSLIGAADDAMVVCAIAGNDAAVQRDLKEMRDILAARARIRAGVYGRCIDCGDAIAYRRLLAYPTAKRCLACQRAHEVATPRADCDAH